MTDRLLLRRLASDERKARNLLGTYDHHENYYHLGKAHAFAAVRTYLQQRMRRRPVKRASK